jgi:HSP20 family protein
MSIFNVLNPAARGTSPAAEPQPAQPTLRPAYEIRETPEAYGLTVYLPGVAKDGLEMTVEKDQVRILGRRGWKQPQGWTQLYRESADVPFELVLRHENTIDGDKVHAEIRDGVLRASLPKAEAVKPRRVEVS